MVLLSAAVPAGKHKLAWRRSSASLVHDECVALATDEEGNKLDVDLQPASLCFPAGTAALSEKFQKYVGELSCL